MYLGSQILFDKPKAFLYYKNLYLVKLFVKARFGLWILFYGIVESLSDYNTTRDLYINLVSPSELLSTHMQIGKSFLYLLLSLCSTSIVKRKTVCSNPKWRKYKFIITNSLCPGLLESHKAQTDFLIRKVFIKLFESSVIYCLRYDVNQYSNKSLYVICSILYSRRRIKCIFIKYLVCIKEIIILLMSNTCLIYIFILNQK